MTPFAVDRRFRVLQFVSSSLLILAHGGNDAQKTMGIITVLLYSQGQLKVGHFILLLWVVLKLPGSHGTWHLQRRLAGSCSTVGSRVTRLTPVQGTCAETGSAAALFAATYLGVPVSHDAHRDRIGDRCSLWAARFSAVRWGITRHILIAWVVTLPASALMAALCYRVARLLEPPGPGFLVPLAFCAATSNGF